MKTALLILALAAACKAPKPPAPAAAGTAEESPAPQNIAVRYVGGQQTDLKVAREVKEKADAANKTMEDSQKAIRQAEGQ